MRSWYLERLTAVCAGGGQRGSVRVGRVRRGTHDGGHGDELEDGGELAVLVLAVEGSVDVKRVGAFLAQVKDRLVRGEHAVLDFGTLELRPHLRGRRAAK